MRNKGKPISCPHFDKLSTNEKNRGLFSPEEFCIMASDPDCIFCKIVRGEIPSDKVYEDDELYAFRDITPQAPVHILIVPKEHRKRLDEYGPGDEEILGKLLLKARDIAESEGLENFRTVINCGEEAGQTVWHLHLHLLGGRPFGWPPG